MKKTYINPEIEVLTIATQEILNGGSGGGIETGSALGDAFDQDDENYSRGSNSLWDDEEDF